MGKLSSLVPINVEIEKAKFLQALKENNREFHILQPHTENI